MKNRLILSLIFSLASFLVGGQEFQLRVIREYATSNSRGLPVVVSGTPFAVLGGIRDLEIGTASGSSRVTVVGASERVEPMFVIPSLPNSVVVAGQVSGNRLGVFRINVISGTLEWKHVEPQRSATSFPLQLIDTGISFVVAAAVEGGVAAIAFNPSTGSEQFRTNIPTTLREATVARDGQENVYLVANRITANGPRVFVRSVTDAGFFRWEREYPFSGSGYEAFSFSIPLLFVANDLDGGAFHVLEADLSNGNLIRSFSHVAGPDPNYRRPVVLKNGSRLLIPFLDNVGRLRLNLDLQTFTGPIENLGATFIDESAALLLGVPIFQAGDDSLGGIKIRPESTWGAIDFGTSFTKRSPVLADNAGRRLLMVHSGSSTSQLIEIIPKPIAQDDAVNAFFNEQQVTFDVTANDLAARPADVEILSQPAGGTVSQNNDGTLTFTANAAKHQTEAFTYRLTRGILSSLATVKIFRQPVGIGLQLSAARVKGGTSVTGRVLMSGPRQGAPQDLRLAENSSATALASPTVQLLPGKTESEPFTVLTARVRNAVRSMITADEGNFSVEELAFLDIDPPFITGIEAVSTTVVGGATAQFRLILDAPAPTNGMPISITDDSTAILVPSTAVVPAGLTAGIFSAPTAVVTSSKAATVTASSNGITKSVTIAIVGVSLALNPTSVVGGQNSIGTITLTSNAIGNSVFFNVTDNSPATAPDPATAIVPAGTRVGNFNIITAPVTSARTATISVANGGVVRSSSLTVRVAALQSLVVSPVQVRGGDPYAGLITLDGKAAGTGVTVGLTSANPIVQLPASQLISAGNTQALFVGSTTRPTTTLMIVITASLNGVTRSTTLIVSP